MVMTFVHRLRFEPIGRAASGAARDRLCAAGGLLIGLLGLGFVGCASQAATDTDKSGPDRPIRILCLGDSITQGGSVKRGPEEYTYRWPLFQILVDHGVRFDFIGSRTQGLREEFKWPAEYKGVPFDPDHEGYYGRKTGKMASEIDELAAKWPEPPDIVLIHLGTNDQGADDYDAAVVQPLRHIINTLRNSNPHVVILVGHLNFNDGAALKIRPLVEQMAKQMNTEQSPVVTVHHYEGWHERPHEPGSDTFDWAHPNPSGQRKMAEKWFEAMKPWLHLSANGAKEGQ